MDIENLEQPKQKEEATGLLAPRKSPTQQPASMVNEPAFRVGQHMSIIRKKREALNA